MVYADYNATTPIGSSARKGIERALAFWGNASSSHQLGREARALLDQSREEVAKAAAVTPEEIVFTSGGSEANTMAILGSYFAHPTDFRLLTSTVEHSSVRDTVGLIESLGAKVERIPVNPNGELDIKLFQEVLSNFKPTLVSLMSANNETGVLFPISEISELCRKEGALFHTDAVQAFGKLAPSLWNWADFISISSHKVFGPKGAGCLIVRKGKPLVSTHYGGAQEIKRRGGTENMLSIAGFAGACEELPTASELDALLKLRNYFESEILKNLDGVSLVGSELNRTPNTSNLRFHSIPNEVLLGALDLDGICVSAGSACSSGSISPSEVLLAMGFSKVEAKQCVRFSFAKTTTKEEINFIVTRICDHVNRIRARRNQ